jgi:hypothetical protein
MIKMTEDMTFEEKFPELASVEKNTCFTHDCSRDEKWCDCEGVRSFTEYSITKSCLSKRRVKEAISNSYIDTDIGEVIDEKILLKELGLEEE